MPVILIVNGELVKEQKRNVYSSFDVATDSIPSFTNLSFAF